MYHRSPRYIQVCYTSTSGDFLYAGHALSMLLLLHWLDDIYCLHNKTGSCQGFCWSLSLKHLAISITLYQQVQRPVHTTTEAAYLNTLSLVTLGHCEQVYETAGRLLQNPVISLMSCAYLGLTQHARSMMFGILSFLSQGLLSMRLRIKVIYQNLYATLQNAAQNLWLVMIQAHCIFCQ